ncbi:Flp family type IVb pilin [Pseudomonas resinovorans]|uniref:Flp family type IVb pilin n=1 Tax=Metapseudomonas resinovorans TaxID=53412 RepID=UPI00237FCC0F|nr:Flp family type IVb pilin [Pseudomonas resinovorans]MDE3739686.1 Flp family type IVb pilin [Pseudomonas resinovorans]
MTFEAIKNSVMKFVKDEDGLTIVEYAVAGGLITVGVVASFVILGGHVKTVIDALATELGKAAANAPAAGGGGTTTP